MSLFHDTLEKLALEAGLPISEAALEKMDAFYALLEQANRSFNLTSIEGPYESALRHFMDSLASPALNRLYPGEHVVDVGTGAGFPGMPIAILREQLHVTLLDSTRKRTDFLSSAVQSLGLPNVTVVTARAEDFARGNGRERFDAALSRAVAPLNVLMEYMLPLIKPGGRAIAWKGPSAAEEAALASNACRVMGGSRPCLFGYSLPGRAEFYIVEVEKQKPTSSAFPRKAGKPSNSPIT